MQISDENLRGRTVVAADGQTTGEVAAVFIDTSMAKIIVRHQGEQCSAIVSNAFANRTGELIVGPVSGPSLHVRGNIGSHEAGFAFLEHYPARSHRGE